MINHLLFRPIKAFSKTAELIVSTYKGVGHGDWSGFAKKGADNPNLLADLRKDWAGAKEDFSMLADNWRNNWRMENPDKMVQIIDDATGNPIQINPEVVSEEIIESEYVEAEAVQQEMDIEYDFEYVQSM